jgi:hypothetical protein
MFCYVADSITGPYRPFPDDEPFVWGSERTRLARSGVFFDHPKRTLFVYGSYPQSQLLEVSKRFPIGWNGKKIGIMFDLQISEIRGG